MEGGGVLRFGLISYQIWSQGPSLGPTKSPEFFGTPGGPGGVPRGVIRGSKGVILDPFKNCSFLLLFSAVNSSYQPKMENLTKKSIFFNSNGPGRPTRGLRGGPGGPNLR